MLTKKLFANLILVLFSTIVFADQPQPRTKYVGLWVNPYQNDIEIDRTLKWLERNCHINTIMLPVQRDSLAYKSKFYAKDFWGQETDRDQVDYLCQWAMKNRKYIIFYLQGSAGVPDKVNGKPSKIFANHPDFKWITVSPTALNEYGFNYGFTAMDNWSMVRYFSDLVRELSDRFRPYALVMNTTRLDQQIIDPKCKDDKALKLEEDFIKTMAYNARSWGTKIAFLIPAPVYEVDTKGRFKSYLWSKKRIEKLRCQMYSKYNDLIVAESTFIPMFVLAGKEPVTKIVSLETGWIRRLKSIAKKRTVIMFNTKLYKDLEKQTYYPRTLNDKDYETQGKLYNNVNVDGLIIRGADDATERISVILDYFELQKKK